MSRKLERDTLINPSLIHANLICPYQSLAIRVCKFSETPIISNASPKAKLNNLDRFPQNRPFLKPVTFLA